MGELFIDTDGEMTFENRERLNLVMHFVKKGAHYSTLETKDGIFVHEDTELSFNEIWLPCAQAKQSKIEQLEKIITARDSQLTGEIAISTKWISEYLRMAKKKAEITRLVQSLRNEFDLWSDEGEGFDAIEAQIKQIEKALRGDEC